MHKNLIANSRRLDLIRVAELQVVNRLIAKNMFANLARHGSRQRFDNHHILWHFEMGDLALAVFFHVVRYQSIA
jgi:hypothetical protein